MRILTPSIVLVLRRERQEGPFGEGTRGGAISRLPDEVLANFPEPLPAGSWPGTTSRTGYSIVATQKYSPENDDLGMAARVIAQEEGDAEQTPLVLAGITAGRSQVFVSRGDLHPRIIDCVTYLLYLDTDKPGEPDLFAQKMVCRFVHGHRESDKSEGDWVSQPKEVDDAEIWAVGGLLKQLASRPSGQPPDND